MVLRRGPAGRPSLYVACYEAVSSRREARRLWLSEKVCDAQTLNQHSEISHTLLALADDTLYLNTNLGAIAPLAADTGRARWVATYPRTIPSLDDTEPAPAHLFRDLTPCLVERGWVVAAPADSNRILFLEATTGRLLAATPPADLTSGIDAIHLLGVAGDRLICSGDYLWWIDMHTGGVVSKFPQSGSTAPGLE